MIFASLIEKAIRPFFWDINEVLGQPHSVLGSPAIVRRCLVMYGPSLDVHWRGLGIPRTGKHMVFGLLLQRL